MAKKPAKTSVASKPAMKKAVANKPAVRKSKALGQASQAVSWPYGVSVGKAAPKKQAVKKVPAKKALAGKPSVKLPPFPTGVSVAKAAVKKAVVKKPAIKVSIGKIMAWSPKGAYTAPPFPTGVPAPKSPAWPYGGLRAAVVAKPKIRPLPRASIPAASAALIKAQVRAMLAKELPPGNIQACLERWAALGMQAAVFSTTAEPLLDRLAALSPAAARDMAAKGSLGWAHTKFSKMAKARGRAIQVDPSLSGPAADVAKALKVVMASRYPKGEAGSMANQAAAGARVAIQADPALAAQVALGFKYGLDEFRPQADAVFDLAEMRSAFGRLANALGGSCPQAFAKFKVEDEAAREASEALQVWGQAARAAIQADSAEVLTPWSKDCSKSTRRACAAVSRWAIAERAC